MKHFVVESTFAVPYEEFGDIVAEHRSYLKNGYDRGWLLYSGLQSPKSGGIIIARAPSREDIEEFFAADPYQQRGLAQFRFIEFEPVFHQAFLEEWLAD